jgi:hypothetical protein
MTTTTKWIDLKDSTTNAKLKVTKQAADDGRTRTYLFVVGMSNASERWKNAIEKLGFVSSPNKKYLVRQVSDGERINAKMFAPVWPNATFAEMRREDVVLDLNAGRRTRESQETRTQEESAVATEVGEVVRLGRNSDGDEVFLSPLGRYIKNDKGNVYEGGALLNPALFLRASDEEQMRLCADGFVHSMVIGEAQHSEDFSRFMRAITDVDGDHPVAMRDRAIASIEAAALRFLGRLYETAQDAYGDAARLYEFMPPFMGADRGKGAMPLPLSVMAQRLLGDTTDKTVLYPNAFDGASFAFLPQGSRIRAFRGSKDLSTLGVGREDVEWADSFDPAREQAGDAMFINADPGRAANGSRSDYADVLTSLRVLNPGGRAVIVLASDESEAPGVIGPVSRGFYDTISRRYQIEAAFEISHTMTDRVGTNRALRVVALRNRAPADDAPMLVEFPVKFSWDEVKSYVDEAIVSIDLKEAETQSIDVERTARENDFQRPYIAFSKVGEARTMVPKNLQAPLQAALSRLELAEGSIDRYVERELGYGPNTLGDRFSPEQVDAVGLSVFRMKSGRAPIIADETGIGKGRILSALATWAEKQGKNVIFITDRSNLFSDLARDLRDIEEWGRFRPLIMNTDGHVVNLFTGETLHPGTPASELRDIVENNRSLQDVGSNMVLTTYSQISAEESLKADWLLNQAGNSLVIVDEAHIAAGSDSNMSRVVLDLVTRAWACAYSSATWAKSSENLHVYARALPEAINIASLARTMKSGGEAFAEVFSGMLARDGGLLRREHDLSKLEFGVAVDTDRLERNNQIADQVAEVLGAMTYVGGEINRLLMRSNNDTLAALKAARNARSQVVTAIREAQEAAGVGRRRRRAAQAVQQEPAQAQEQPVAAQPVAEAQPAAAEVPEHLAAPLVTGTMFRSSFGAGTVLYQVMRRLLALLNADNVADLALKALDEGRKPVIVFEETGETFVKRIVAEHTLPGMDGERSILPDAIPVPTIKDLLFKVVNRMGVVVSSKVDESDVDTRANRDEDIDVEEVLFNEEGSSSASVVKVEDLPGLSDEAREQYRDGLQRIVDLINKLPPLPLNSVDLVRARLENSGLRVGEISGRRMTLNVPDTLRTAAIDSDWSSAANWRIAFRKKTKPELNKTVYAFNHGELDAVIINRSAAAGISLHASPRFSDRRRRELIEMQIPENPTDRIQLYGRVNRYDQVVGPKIAVASTGVYGETRQLMMQNKKLARLSANTRSSRENAAEIKHVVDLLNPIGEKVCRKFLEDNGGIRQRLGISEHELENSGFSAASKLTSRLVLLKVVEQKAVYEDLYEAFDEEVIRLDLAGENPLRAKEMDIRAVTTQERIAIGVDMEGLGSAFDGPVYLKNIEWKEDRRPISWPDLVGRVKEGQEKLLAAGFALPSKKAELSEVVYAQSSEIDWENDIWHVGREANEKAKAFLDAREKELALAAQALPEKTILAQGIEVWAAPESVQIHASIPPVTFSRDDIDALTRSYCQRTFVVDQIDASASIDVLIRILDAKCRIELVGTKFVDLADALAAKTDNAVRRAWSKKMWLEKNFKHLMPGCVISIDDDLKKGNTTFFTQKTGIITSLVAPPKGKEAQLQRWKIEWFVPGDEKVRSVSLASLLDDVKLTASVEEAGSVKTELLGGPVLSAFGFDGRSGRVDDLQASVNASLRGQRKRSGYILDGNLYLASEWAQATGKGFGVIYTDDRGVRHRAVMLKERILGGEADVFNHLPIRLWNRQMLGALAHKLWSPDTNGIPTNYSGGYLLATDFVSAMNQVRDGNKSEVLVQPGAGIAMTMERKDLARVSRALRSEVKTMLAERYPNFNELPAEEQKRIQESMPKVSTSAKRGAKPIVMVAATTAEEAVQAVEILSRAVGLEVYVWPHAQIGRAAAEVVEGYFTERREAARLLRAQAEEARSQRERAEQLQPPAQEDRPESLPRPEVAPGDGTPAAPARRMAA